MDNYDELKINDNRDYINNTTQGILSSGKKIIQNTVKNKIKGLKDELNKVPSIYNKMKNNFTITNNREIKKMNENIANTGNHTAGGYAISKRLNNINEYNKGLADIDARKEEHISDINNKISNAEFEGEIEFAKLNKDILDKNLDLILDENKRIDDYNLDVLKFNEEKRMNDADIVRINNDIILSNNKDKRENDIHNIEAEYLPLEKEANLENLKLKGDLTKAQINNAKIKSVSGGSSGGGSGETVLSKMSAKNIADSILNQIATISYDTYGNKEQRFSENKAYAMLKGWQKKYNLPDHIINDASIYLGIQDFM